MIVNQQQKAIHVLDGHVHVGRRHFTTTVTGGRSGDYLADEHVAAMDAAGVDAAVIFPRANPHTDYADANAETLEAARRYPTRLIPYVRVQPYFPEAAHAVATFISQGARGLKLHPMLDFAGNAVNRPDMLHPVVEAAVKGRVPILIHSGGAWNAEPALIWDLAMTFPDGHFIIGHSGQREGHQSAIALARRTENLYFDTSAAPPAVIRNVVQSVGHERVFFGSDCPALPYGMEIRTVMQYAGLPSSEAEAIMGRNLGALLGWEPQGDAPTVRLETL